MEAQNYDFGERLRMAYEEYKSKTGKLRADFADDIFPGDPIDEKDHKNRVWYLSRWMNNQGSLGKCTPDICRRICLAAGVSGTFLLQTK